MDKKNRQGLTINGRMEFIRRLHDLTRKQWAEELGVNPHVIENIEYGKQRVTSEILEAISEQYPYVLNYIVTGEAQITFTREEKNFLKELESYSTDEVKEVLNSKPKKRY
ncbi:helix-turn-helix domain-containing protein [Endozoicomonas arenosclerae]|uniref:helix-turn-helix domain-containing protein n=1 Tax=Endozoicomonas arenosclerae TaxID=1633495 RepID=UPI0007861103|nr:helix-turn-helix domain-containing protein [Endozoicomonas arenosclerae]